MHILFIVLLILLAIIVLFLIALHLGFRAPKTEETKTPEDFGIAYQAVSIPTLSNKKLFGWLLNANNSKETIIILHGWGGNAELMMPIAKPFYDAGMNVLLIDSRGHGRSDSDTFSSLPRFAEDLGQSINWLKENHPNSSQKIALLGHSVGAGAVLLEASRRSDIDAVISISAFAHPEWMMKRFLGGLHLPKFLISIILKYVEWIIGLQFASFAPLSTVCNIDAPILITHGKDDTTIPIEDAHAIIKHCPKPHITLFEVEDAGHESVNKFEENSGRFIQFLYDSSFLVEQKNVEPK